LDNGPVRICKICNKCSQRSCICIEQHKHERLSTSKNIFKKHIHIYRSWMLSVIIFYIFYIWLFFMLRIKSTTYYFSPVRDRPTYNSQHSPDRWIPEQQYEVQYTDVVLTVESHESFRTSEEIGGNWERPLKACSPWTIQRAIVESSHQES